MKDNKQNIHIIIPNNEAELRASTHTHRDRAMNRTAVNMKELRAAGVTTEIMMLMLMMMIATDWMNERFLDCFNNSININSDAMRKTFICWNGKKALSRIEHTHTQLLGPMAKETIICQQLNSRFFFCLSTSPLSLVRSFSLFFWALLIFQLMVQHSWRVGVCIQVFWLPIYIKW